MIKLNITLWPNWHPILTTFSSAGFARRMGEWFDQDIDRVASRLELPKDKELRFGMPYKFASIYRLEM